MSALGDLCLTKLSNGIVDEIQRLIVKRGRRNVISQRHHAKDDEEAIVTWRLDLDRIRHQQTVENQGTDYNPMVLHLRVVTHCTRIYRNIIVCHFQITGG